MMPTQVMIIPITDRQHEYAHEVEKKLLALGIRTECDCRSEKVGYKIREAQMEKIPFMLVLGDKEMEDGTVAVRSRKDGGDIGTMPLGEFTAMILEMIANHSRD